MRAFLPLAILMLAAGVSAEELDAAALDALFDGARRPGVQAPAPGAGRSIFENAAPLALAGHANQVQALEFSKDGETLLTAGSDKIARVWDARSGRELKSIPLQISVDDAAFSADWSLIVIGGTNTVRILDGRTGEPLSAFGVHARKVAISPDGSRVVASYWEELYLYDARTGVQLCSLKQLGTVTDGNFSPDGKRFLTSVKGVRVWDVESCRELAHFQPVDEDVKAAVFSPDGKTVATGGSLGNVHLWDAAAGVELKRLEGHADDVNAVAFSPDGKKLASGSDDKTVRVWDLATGKALKTLTHAKRVTAVAFNPDGARVAAASGNGDVTLWRVGYSVEELDQIKRDLNGKVDAAPSTETPGRFRLPDFE